MRGLGIDCSTNALSVAVWNDETVEIFFSICPSKHAEQLLPAIERLFSKQDFSLQSLDCIAVGVGPGSFIGNRTALSVVKALAFALNKPVIALSSLQIIAQTAYQKHECDNVAVAWDARLGAAYFGIYKLLDGIMQPQVNDAVAPAETDLLASLDTPDYFAAGNAWEVCPELKKSRASYIGCDVDCFPEPTAIVQLARAMFASGKFCSGVDIAANYLRNNVAHSGRVNK